MLSLFGLSGQIRHHVPLDRQFLPIVSRSRFARFSCPLFAEQCFQTEYAGSAGDGCFGQQLRMKPHVMMSFARSEPTRHLDWCSNQEPHDLELRIVGCQIRTIVLNTDVLDG